MKFLITFSLSVLLSYLSGIFMPWWTFTLLVAFIHALFPVKPGMAFLSGFTALLVLWGSLSFYMDWANHHILSKKIALLFLQQETHGCLIAVTAIIGALAGGLSALTGSLARGIITNE
jgi:hypothetical protein